MAGWGVALITGSHPIPMGHVMQTPDLTGSQKAPSGAGDEVQGRALVPRTPHPPRGQQTGQRSDFSTDGHASVLSGSRIRLAARFWTSFAL